MAGFKDMGTGARSALLASGAVILVAAGYGLWSVNQVAPPPDPAPANLAPADLATKTLPPPDTGKAAAAPLAADATAYTAALAPKQAIAAPLDGEQPAPTEDAQPADSGSPTFDLVRVEPDGQALVAGKAAPGAQVVLRLDGEALSATTADAQGNFVVLFVLDPSPVPRMLTMASILPDLSEIPADAEIALAPTVAPVVSAAPAIIAAPAVSAQATPDPAAAPDLAEPPDLAAEAKIAADTSLAASAPAALLVTKDGVNLLPTVDQSAATDVPSLLAIDTISYTPAGDVQLAGRATAGAFVRIYLDNAPLIDLPVGDDGRWASTMPMIAPGLYTLRADALAADGTVTARFETPFKRETKDALASAAQTQDLAPAMAKAVPAADPQSAADPAAMPPAEPAAVPPAKPAAVPAAETATETASPAPGEPEPPAATADVALAPVAPADKAESAQIAPVAEPGPTNPVSITVQPGFTLWGIASEQFGDGVLYVQVFEANKDKIRDPNLIYPGQVFVIPAASE